MNGTFEKMAEIINGREQRSAWRRGVTAYALELLEELKKTREGERRPNSREEWLDVQARALTQAARVVRMAYQKAIKK